MRKFNLVLMGFLGILFFGGLAEAYAAPMEAAAKMRSVSGEIEKIDVKLGLLQLKGDAGQDTRGITEYKINQNGTRVTDSTDTKFIVIKDLRVGQHVTIQLIDGPEELMVRKIIAEPMPELVLQEITGKIEFIDAQAGNLVINEEPLPGEKGEGRQYYLIFEPNDIVFMKNPSLRPVRLELSPGDLVKVEFIIKDGKRYARSITLLPAATEITSTTTTTITSTTVTE
jgi:hypothetical protein